MATFIAIMSFLLLLVFLANEVTLNTVVCLGLNTQMRISFRILLHQIKQNEIIDDDHKLIKSRRYNMRCVFSTVYFWTFSLFMLLAWERKGSLNEATKAKCPLYYKALFCFPSLLFHPAVLYLLMFEFSIVIVNHVKELGPFIDLCLDPTWNVSLSHRSFTRCLSTNIINPTLYCLCWTHKGSPLN